MNNSLIYESDKVVLNEEEEDINELIVQMESETPKHRYLKIFHKGKELARLASNDGVTTKKALDIMQKEINDILEIPNDAFIENNINLMTNSTEIESDNSKEGCQTNSNESIEFHDIPIVDAIAKPKGKPKKGRKPKPMVLMENSKKHCCSICTFQHKTEQCHFYNEMNKLLEENKIKYQNQEGRHCSICGGLNHQKRTCELRKKAIEYYSQAKFI